MQQSPFDTLYMSLFQVWQSLSNEEQTEYGCYKYFLLQHEIEIARQKQKCLDQQLQDIYMNKLCALNEQEAKQEANEKAMEKIYCERIFFITAILTVFVLKYLLFNTI